MANNRYRCPGCSGYRRREIPERRENLNCVETQNTPLHPERCSGSDGVFSCEASNPVSAQLYGAVCEPALYRECCDSQCGCRVFEAGTRDPFWPDFAHPRWLGCEELYIMPAFIRQKKERHIRFPNMSR